jgi:hypothetical protein
MTFAPTTSRRWLAVGFLALAVGMMIYGLAFLDRHLALKTFVLYWTVCLMWTLLAAWTALLDVRSIQNESREAQRELIEETLEQIERDRPADRTDRV